MKLSTCAFAVALAASSFVAAPSVAQAADLVPNFAFIAPGWLSPPLTIGMGQFWSAAGLPETGTNYYSMGAPSSSSTPYWERFDPSSPLYQAWFGTYVVDDFQYPAEWNHPTVTVADIPNSIQRVVALATVDQLAWLTGYGDPHPLASVAPSSVVVVPAPNGYFILYAQMQSHSDVGGTIPTYSWYPPYSVHSSQVAPYANVTLNTVCLFKYIPSKGELVVVYSSGTQWSTLDGASHVTPPSIAAQQLGMVLGTTFPGT